MSQGTAMQARAGGGGAVKAAQGAKRCGWQERLWLRALAVARVRLKSGYAGWAGLGYWKQGSAPAGLSDGWGGEEMK